MRSYTPGNIAKPAFEKHEIWASRSQLDLEIGAGQGLHAIQYARNNPERMLIAVERTRARFAKLEQRKINHPELTNLIALHADVEALVAHHVPDNSLASIILLYPNPYPKQKQANLRWHNQPFMALLLRKLKGNGTLTLATNLEWYAREAEENFIRTWNLELISSTTIAPTDPPRTHFEKKYLARGETCWNLIFRKVQ